MLAAKAIAVVVEFWPTRIVIPEGYRISLQVRGRDYEHPPAVSGETEAKVGWFPVTGCGPFLHDDPEDRPPEIFGGRVTLYTAGGRDSYLPVPSIPENGQ